MANQVDQDRLNDTTRGGVVVDLAAYRAAAEGVKNTAVSLFDPVAVKRGFWIILALVAALILVRRFVK